MPGHYLQGVYANRSSSLPRSIFQSGLFAEGWAVYVTQVMIDAGYGADDPALLLNHWKFYLRSVTNAIIDAWIHCHGMTEDEAVALMVDGGFQEEAIRNKRPRAPVLDPASTFAGSMEMWTSSSRHAGARPSAAGADASVVRPGALPGGFGETPGFRYRQHLESVIAHGAPPIAAAAPARRAPAG